MLVVVGLGMVALLGFCALGVDYSILISTRNHLQRACDAAALAGAAELPASDSGRQAYARSQAEITAFNNGVPVSEIVVSFPATNRIQVSAQRSVNSLFAKAIGVMSRNVVAQAQAGRDALRGVPGAAPLAITTEDYHRFKDGTSFEERLVDNNRQDFVRDTMVALDLRLGNMGKSPAHFEEDLRNGVNETVELNQQINNTLNASLNAQGAKMEDAINARIARAGQAPWNGTTYTFPNIPHDHPRVITIIVADPNPQDNSNPMITARFFAPVYIEGIEDRGNNDYYLRLRILPARNYSSTDPGIILGDASTPDSGVGVVRLLS